MDADDREELQRVEALMIDILGDFVLDLQWPQQASYLEGEYGCWPFTCRLIKKSVDPMMIHCSSSTSLVLVKMSEKRCCGGHCDSTSLQCTSDVAHHHHYQDHQGFD